MASEILLELGAIIGIAAVLAIFCRLIKQPTIIAYLIAGILIGPLFFNVLKSTELVQIFSHLGVAFLLFIVGLSLDFRALRGSGKVAMIVGISQILITGFVGFIIAMAFGFSNITSLFLAAALSFSSTLFVVKILSDKGEIDTLHGKITLGILIVQDFIAAIALLIVPIIGSPDPTLIYSLLLKGVVLIAGVFLFSHLLIPAVLNLAAKNQEILFLFSIGWALAIALAFNNFGLSIEIGALIAGMSLASSKFSLEISNKVKGLREFFVIIHLVFFGSLLVGPITGKLILATVLFSLLVFVGDQLIVMSFMKFFGYKKRTNFLTGISIAQISELSLILLFIGFSVGIVSQEALSLTILVALITIAASTYSIHYSKYLYKIFIPLLGIFDGKGLEVGKILSVEKPEIVLFGYDRMGFSLVKAFRKSKKKILVVDYNPQSISELSKKRVPVIYGDANDLELLESLNLNQSKIIISTIPDLEPNLTILGQIRNSKIIFIPTSHNIRDTRKLYDAGADYVIMPHFLGGSFMANMFLSNKLNKESLAEEGRKQLSELKERLEEGHEHPRKEAHGS